MTRLFGTAAAIAILGAGISGTALAQYQTYQPNPYPQGYGAYPQQTVSPQYGTSSYQYPPGPGGQWQQNVVTSQGTTMADPAYMPSAARLGTDGGVTVPAYGSTYPPPGYTYPPGYGYPVR